MRKPLVLALLLAAVLAVLTAPPPAQAFSADAWGSKLVGTIVDTFGIIGECPKTINREVALWKERFIVAVPLTAAGGCLGSTVARIVSVGSDWATTIVPVTTEHMVKQRSWDGLDPLVPLPK